MHGFIVIDKPAGITSHDVVARVRRILKCKKVGHTGTLDPFATGVLPVALGEGTKGIPFLDEGVKEYRAVMRLGATTDTDDREGAVTGECALDGIGDAQILEAAVSFTGIIAQIPPMYSALKQNGVPLYKLARKGEEVERPPRQVTIFSLTVDLIDLPHVAFSVSCSRGTYVRSLARDMGERLGCGAHLTELRRTRSGLFTLEHARTLEQVADEAACGSDLPGGIPLAEALEPLPSVQLTAEGERLVRNGRLPQGSGLAEMPAGFCPGQKIRLMHDSLLVAVAEVVSERGGELLRLLRVFN